MASAGNSSSLEYMHELLEKAEEFCSGNFDDVTFLYRNKSEEYFLDVKKNNNVMKRIRKDDGGDPLSPINGKLKGIFFGVTLYKGNLPTISPFGDTRVHIPIRAVFRESSNLYFADFYCFTTEIHYITLVLTKNGSKADEFCQKNLPHLDPSDNEFLMRNGTRNPSFSTVSQRGLFVEVFYTEDVDIQELRSKYGSKKVFLTKTSLYGKGHSTPGGIPKHKYCRVCNLHKRDYDDEEDDSDTDESDGYEHDYSDEEEGEGSDQSGDEDSYGPSDDDDGEGESDLSQCGDEEDDESDYDDDDDDDDDEEGESDESQCEEYEDDDESDDDDNDDDDDDDTEEEEENHDDNDEGGEDDSEEDEDEEEEEEEREQESDGYDYYDQYYYNHPDHYGYQDEDDYYDSDYDRDPDNDYD